MSMPRFRIVRGHSCARMLIALWRTSRHLACPAFYHPVSLGSLHDIKSAYLTIIKVGMNLLKIRNPKVQALIVLIVINWS